MGRLSSPLSDLKDRYQIVVIGSGYGGGIAASRLARAGQQVCLLERGREFLPGEFPDTMHEATDEVQFDTPHFHLGSRTGLFDFHVNKEMNVLVGCGLGGTSLINANVVIKLDPRVFEEPVWPRALIADLDAGLAQGYQRAHEMLNARPYPDNFPSLKKLEAQFKSAADMKQEVYRPDIAVTFAETKDNLNHVGVKQTPCILCGDCVSGCNHTSKNTVQTNYLADAWNHGAEIFTQVNVRYIEKQGGKWNVHFQVMETGSEAFDAPTQFVRADIVIVSAGTLGSTEILLRSRDNGLELSSQLGKRFSGNGDVLAFGYNTDPKINGIGWGTRTPDADNPVGPCITTIIDTRKNAKKLEDGMSIEEGSIPGALSPVLPVSFGTLAKLVGKDTDEGLIDYLREKKRVVESYVAGPYHGAVNHTQTYLVMSHDGADGEMKLEDDRLRIDWPGVGDRKIFKKVQKKLREATKALGGTYIKNPIWTKLMGHDLVTVHPLGGCVMGENATDGAVNHKGQVFSGDSGDAVHDGLYVTDGAVIPTSLGTNPLFTISAVSERNMALLAEDRGWSIDYTLPSKPTRKPLQLKPGVQFTETMKGYFSTKQKDDYEKAARLGEEDGSTFEFTLTVRSNDLEKMLKEKQHKAAMFGTVKASALSGEALNVTEGVFNLFVEYEDEVETRRMEYRMKMTSQEGKSFYFEGFKTIRDDPAFDLWHDTTTLYITVHDGQDSKAPVLGKGVLKIDPSDFLKQLKTMKVLNVEGRLERLKYLARFGSFFAGVLLEQYGGIFPGLSYFDPDKPPRKRRILRVSAPETHEVKTEDGYKLRLTRYQGGKKGPVILVHGLGVSSRIFAMDTYETNLLEYLFAHEYDVWLFDFRASIALPQSRRQFTADDIARYDFVSAIERVKRESGAANVQMVVHCYGATAWTMAMLGGYISAGDVRGAVVSQISAHVKVPFLTKIKVGLHIPEALDKLGVESLTAYTDEESEWESKLYDKFLKLYPYQLEERCNNPVCHRITFMYGALYEHDRLNEPTHENLHEMFGLANMESFEHLATMIRAGHVLTFAKEDVYLPHPERMALPITFIHGEENECYLPESTLLTYNWLRKHNGDELYNRFVIPGYGHIDCIFGKNAVNDVYPHILAQLETTA